MAQKVTSREKRKARIRRKISGTAARPRLTVYRSLRHMYAQLVDDVAGTTLVSIGSTTTVLKDEVAEEAKGITAVVFDRNGFDYHGRVAAIAAGAREGGLLF
jgi:large subunit ribosomal protein L18